jgi:hypothetical protein
MHVTSVLTTFIAVMGAFSVVCSIHASIFFYQIVRGGRGATCRLSFALFVTLIGEAVVVFGTLIFSVAQHFGWIENWGVFTNSFIRFCMFASTSTTTCLLLYTCKRIVLSNSNTIHKCMTTITKELIKEERRGKCKGIKKG